MLRLFLFLMSQGKHQMNVLCVCACDFSLPAYPTTIPIIFADVEPILEEVYSLKAIEIAIA